MSRQNAIDHWRTLEVKEAAALVLDDKPLQKLLAAWPIVGATDTAPFFDLPAAGSWDSVWSGMNVDLALLAALTGLHPGQAALTFERAKGLRLIYPDGTIHTLAKAVLQKRIKAAVQG